MGEWGRVNHRMHNKTWIADNRIAIVGDSATFGSMVNEDGLTMPGRLEALLSRSVMYELVALGEEMEIGGRLMYAVRSKGEVFPIMPADELSRRVSQG